MTTEFPALKPSTWSQGMSLDDCRPVFQHAWEAQAFAIVQALQDAGLFTKIEWSNALGHAIAMAGAQGDADTGETYYLHWLAALEGLVVSKGVAGTDQLSRYHRAWAHATHRTPHGAPAELTSEDFVSATSPDCRQAGLAYK